MKQKQTFDLDQQLASIPMRNARVTAKVRASDTTPILEVPLRRPAWMTPLRKLLGMPDCRRFQLDPAGQQVYDRIDGRKSFENLIDEFAAPYKLTFFESRGLLMVHIRNLMKNGLVVVGIRCPPESAPKH